MIGTVKWVSNEKPFGFITHSIGNKHTDYHFRFNSVDGPDIPERGDLVEFDPKSGSKGLYAEQVKIVKKVSSQHVNDAHSSQTGPTKRTDDRLVCKSCNRKMTPRIKFAKGEPVARICPYCMASQEESSIGAIAAIATGLISLWWLGS